MKKIIASAVGLMMFSGVAVTGAMAAESQFGGYWRTRMIYDDNMNGDDSGSNYITDTRTRLYYTAKFSDHFKFVNKFEFDAKWGDSSLGDIGADGKDFEIKNSYLDYTMGMVNTKLGIQGAVISRGFIFDNDFSGAVVTADFGGFKIPVLYAAAVDEEVRSNTTSVVASGLKDNTLLDVAGNPVLDDDGNVVLRRDALANETGAVDGDVHLLSIMPSFKISDTMQLTPHVTYQSGTSGFDTDLWWLGADIDMKFDTVSAWGTFIYNTGEVGTVDVDGFLVAAGADAGLVHGQAFYASGDDGDGTDSDTFVSAPGQSYYWSEIMGYGVFDNGNTNSAPDDQISNVWAANLGVTLKPAEKLTTSFDVWYAELAEDNAAGDDELGLEFDAKVTYALEDNLNVDFIFAYLVAGDAMGDDDVIEGGVRVSLAF